MGSPNGDAWRSITWIPRAFAYRIASRTMRAPWPRPRWAGSVNTERRKAASVPFQFGRGWTCMTQTQPLATGSPPTSTMKAREPVRLDLLPRPAPVYSVGRVEVRFRDAGDVLPHAAPVADEEIQVLECCPTDRAANHDARIRSGDLSFPHPRSL